MLETTGAMLDNFAQRALRVLLTYTAVSITGCVIILVLMLFAGGYFFNIGTRLNNLSVETARLAGFEVTRISLKGGVQTRDQDIISALYDREEGQALGRSLLHVNLRDTRQRIEDIGWVKHASITRLWPDTLHVSISERIPSALWQPDGQGELLLIDREGAVITRVGSHQYTGLPLVINTDDPTRASKILAHLALYPGLSARIAALKEQGNRRWDLVFRDNFVVKLPEDDFEKALKELYELDAQSEDLSAALEYLDLRNKDTVYYDPKS
ncbi:cell division protein FtsQ/DivIB [Parvularcula sp. IMCC14364]|uniref:cell division protein FtsQ/DivIB n=1 Tax=Parvularcula sp. IMCC14364 TaxID=3067902 RepID=UPI002741EEFF|nr:cell division protein FtsQ/DivIB [Parvularcula sp. IMCC14364]